MALKALLPYYAGKVKCIYIDPPYNTSEESWVYNDNSNNPEIQAWLGKTVGPEAEDLSRHDKWLCMMLPRLELLRQFLREDGVIFVSIDDNSVGFLRLLMDEVFGINSFVATIVWQKRYSRENRAHIGDVHEYLLVYAPDPEKFKAVRNYVPLDDKSAAAYQNPNNDPRGPWQSISFTAQGWRPNQMYPITGPNGQQHTPPKGRCWSSIEPEYKKLLADGRFWFGKDGNGVPRLIRYLSEVEGLVPWTWWPHDEVGHTDEAKKEMLAIAGDEEAFDTPKPERLLNRIIGIATNEGDLVLDCFAGSGTTGAVAQKMKRRWLMVEQGSYCETLVSKRLRMVTEGSDQGGVTQQTGWKGGSGFRYVRLGVPLFAATGELRAEVTFADLAAHVFFTETGAPLPKPKHGHKTPFLGAYHGLGVYLLFNGILGDKRVNGGNVLTGPLLASLPPHDGPRVIYGEGCRLGAERLKREGVTFKQIPYQIKVS